MFLNFFLGGGVIMIQEYGVTSYNLRLIGITFMIVCYRKIMYGVIPAGRLLHRCKYSDSTDVVVYPLP